MPRRKDDVDSYVHNPVNIKALLAGSTDAWQGFVEHYSGLIYAVVKRCLPSESYDDVRTVYVDVLEYLYRSGLSKYKPTASLSSWLIVVTRRKALDVLRSKRGRIREPAGLSALSDLERRVFQLVYVERHGLGATAYCLSEPGRRVAASHVVDAIMRIEERVDRRVLDRTDARYGRYGCDRESERLLRYIVATRADHDSLEASSPADEALIEQEASKLAAEVRKLLESLTDEEQAVIRLRFEEQLPARKVSSQLQLGDTRRVYTIVDRVIRKLRAALES